MPIKTFAVEKRENRNIDSVQKKRPSYKRSQLLYVKKGGKSMLKSLSVH
jgi:hypothetical protein